jgi:glucokinase
MSLLGIDLGGTKLALTQFSLEGAALYKESIPLAGRKNRDVGVLITDTIAGIIKSNQNNNIPVQSIGISVPGISRIKTGTVWAPNIPGWEDYPLLSEVQEVSGEIPVIVDSDRACSILGEIWQGNAAGCKDVIFLTVGTGIGAGILVNGTILRGSHDISGAVGWMALKTPFIDEYTNCGCFEYYASGNGIARVAQKLLQEDKTYSGQLKEKAVEEIASHDVFAAFEANDPMAKEVFRICVNFWGMAVANLVSIFNPEKIIFGGGVFGPAVQFIPAIKTEALKWAQPISIHQVSIEASALGSEAAVYGAGYMAMQSIHTSD